MTDPKHPCPHCDGRTVAQGQSWSCRECGYRFDGVIGGTKPLVPSDEELYDIEDEGPLSFALPSIDERRGRRRLWLAGYHARGDACCHQTLSVLATKLTASERRIVELEAEVAELRKRTAQLEEVAHSRGVALAQAHRVADLAPRRTPELTERVAEWLLKHSESWPIAFCRADAEDLLDVVFEQGCAEVASGLALAQAALDAYHSPSPAGGRAVITRIEPHGVVGPGELEWRVHFRVVRDAKEQG